MNSAIHHTGKRHCGSDICIFEMIPRIPFKSGIYPLLLQQIMRFLYVISHRGHNGIPGFLLFVSKAEIYAFRMNFSIFHKIHKAGEPYGRGRRRHSFECICLIRRPQGKKPRQRIASDDEGFVPAGTIFQYFRQCIRRALAEALDRKSVV